VSPPRRAARTVRSGVPQVLAMCSQYSARSRLRAVLSACSVLLLLPLGDDGAFVGHKVRPPDGLAPNAAPPRHPHPAGRAALGPQTVHLREQGGDVGHALLKAAVELHLVHLRQAAVVSLANW
jgi:hypothetical protein